MYTNTYVVHKHNACFLAALKFSNDVLFTKLVENKAGCCYTLVPYLFFRPLPLIFSSSPFPFTSPLSLPPYFNFPPLLFPLSFSPRSRAVPTIFPRSLLSIISFCIYINLSLPPLSDLSPLSVSSLSFSPPYLSIHLSISISHFSLNFTRKTAVTEKLCSFARKGIQKTNLESDRK